MANTNIGKGEITVKTTADTKDLKQTEKDLKEFQKKIGAFKGDLADDAVKSFVGKDVSKGLLGSGFGVAGGVVAAGAATAALVAQGVGSAAWDKLTGATVFEREMERSGKLAAKEIQQFDRRMSGVDTRVKDAFGSSFAAGAIQVQKELSGVNSELLGNEKNLAAFRKEYEFATDPFSNAGTMSSKIFSQVGLVNDLKTQAQGIQDQINTAEDKQNKLIEKRTELLKKVATLQDDARRTIVGMVDDINSEIKGESPVEKLARRSGLTSKDPTVASGLNAELRKKQDDASKSGDEITKSLDNQLRIMTGQEDSIEQQIRLWTELNKAILPPDVLKSKLDAMNKVARDIRIEEAVEAAQSWGGDGKMERISRPSFATPSRGSASEAAVNINQDFMRKAWMPNNDVEKQQVDELRKHTGLLNQIKNNGKNSVPVLPTV